MECDRCDEEAIIAVPYAGTHLCGTHLCRSVEKRVRRRVRDDTLLPRVATPENPETWIIGLSGGKDSVVLTTILHETFAEDPRVELQALTIHEGIEGYRDASLAACRELTTELSLPHEVVTYRDEFDVEMDEVATEDPLDMAACAYCGVFRRDILDRYANELGADKLLTGHNLDDEAQTALMNLFSGDVEQMAKHFDASLGGFDDRDIADDPFIPRAKPLRDVPEREVALYAHTRDLPVHMVECPHAERAYRGEIQDLLLDLESNHPGTRHSIMSGYEELAKLAAQSYRSEAAGSGRKTCERCGSPTSGSICRRCDLLETLHAES